MAAIEAQSLWSKAKNLNLFGDVQQGIGKYLGGGWKSPLSIGGGIYGLYDSYKRGDDLPGYAMNAGKYSLLAYSAPRAFRYAKNNFFGGEVAAAAKGVTKAAPVTPASTPTAAPVPTGPSVRINPASREEALAVGGVDWPEYKPPTTSYRVGPGDVPTSRPRAQRSISRRKRMAAGWVPPRPQESKLRAHFRSNASGYIALGAGTAVVGGAAYMSSQ